MDTTPVISESRPPPTVTYWAISILNSKTFWVGVATTMFGLWSDPEIRGLVEPLLPLVVQSVVPLAYLPRVLTVLGIVIVILRKFTQRPVVVRAAPFAVTPVEVPRLGPPQPPPILPA